MQSSSFNGFSKETIQFFVDLEMNNSRTWFTENRHIYDNYVMPQAQAFVVELGLRLKKKIAPQIQAIPKTDKSIFRLHRDVRFSPDKSPYKTHLGLYLWEGPGKKMECPGFYFQLSSAGIMLGAGMHIFPKHILPLYRETVAHEKHGADLKNRLKKVLKNEGFSLKEKRYKKTPRGFDPENPNADLLLYDGVAVMYASPTPKNISKPEFMDFVFDTFSGMEPLHHWFIHMLNQNHQI